MYICLSKVKCKMDNSRNYPTTSHNFPIIINSGAIYVDKTQFIVPLLAKDAQANYFLSRPRRFGKSLLVSTLEQVFLGNKALFKGLYIEDKINWEETYPVVRISMDKIGFTDLGLEKALFEIVQNIAKDNDIVLENASYSTRFSELIKKIYKKHQKRVVILIDEYDKPIINYVEKDNVSQAETNRNILKSFYGILKDNGEYLRFVFLTGVSKFSKVSIFSDLNYFDDLTLDTRYATMCGFTEAELRQYCYAGLEDLAAKENVSQEAIMDKIRYWYNGFSWNAHDFVYNPYSTMLLMDRQVFDNFWFESGTPTFLVKLINPLHIYQFDDVIVEKDDFNWHDLKNLDYISLMLQTGYLTLKKDLADGYFKAEYPNKEVEIAFSKMLLKGYMYKQPSRMSTTILDIQEALESHQLEKVIQILKDMFGILPSHFFEEEKEITDAKGNKKTVSKAVGESFYHAIIYLVFNILGIRMPVEVTTQDGRIDAVVETEGYIYIFEFKKDKKAKTAIDQIIKRNYPQHFALSKKPIYLIGVSFSLQKRGISDHKIEPFKIPPSV